MDTSRLFAQLLDYAKTQQNVKYTLLASAVFAGVEAFHCLPEEVSLIWTGKWNLGKILYLASRYLAFVELIGPAPLFILSPDLSVGACQRIFAAGATLSVIEVTVSEAILFLRVYALGGTDRKLGAFLLALYLGIHGAVYACLYKFLNSIIYMPSPFPNLVSCLPIRANNHMLSVVFILLLASELVILAITFWLCFTKHKSTNSPLVATFSRDGLSYFVLLSGESQSYQSPTQRTPCHCSLLSTYSSAVSTGNIVCNLVAPVGASFTPRSPSTSVVFDPVMTRRSGRSSPVKRAYGNSEPKRNDTDLAGLSMKFSGIL
ncbi:hypothetical protein DFP72DRAFT_187448 [Ephemerocybe angulata]|uniref:DUF6533 domain-containing protein n=1 Tax=Ephemerocybe angulata TaxID=980116 RepID=A0A8H6M7X1_9AGAR|nr:hypothetical protein DFP72DRAFT_187448 [Tulosesus angulatus]